MLQVEMISISGFETAILGTGMRTSNKEVLVYDGDKAQRILDDRGMKGTDIIDYVRSLGIDDLGEDAPIFVFFDNYLSEELDGLDGIESNSIH